MSSRKVWNDKTQSWDTVIKKNGMTSILRDFSAACTGTIIPASVTDEIHDSVGNSVRSDRANGADLRSMPEVMS